MADLRHAGVQPLGMAVRNAGLRGGAVRHATARRTASAARSALDADRAERGQPGRRLATAQDSRRGGCHAVFHAAATGGQPTSGHGTPIGQVDPALMSLIRRLAFSRRRRPPAGDGGGATARLASGGSADAAPPPNLILAHRDELRQASRGALDHMVIDVIGSLFDQILSDPKVPPQMARQIARLQLPVLRAALGDPSFFSSRRHPVRRFVNRIASLGAAFEDFDSEEGAQRLLAKVRELVQEVVEGDFDQIEVYEQKLAALESFIAEQGQAEAAGRRATRPTLLADKEDELRAAPALRAAAATATARTCRRRTSCATSSATSGARCCCRPPRRAAPTARWRSACAASAASCS